ncbi:hypothetical protein JEM67_21610 [Serratia sp. PAMC26656]|uniref:hypothetical protein n=1 Tax=Serratia sp. PAMC26656 TaxID=2775909 RepID=UPI0018F38AA6|nr:hypothetical protein [Serratia sp. PAMC26656]MBJ7892094.1 hypothetical protein [Serratia sp. PAMC26656]
MNYLLFECGFLIWLMGLILVFKVSPVSQVLEGRFLLFREPDGEVYFYIISFDILVCCRDKNRHAKLRFLSVLYLTLMVEPVAYFFLA